VWPDEIVGKTCFLGHTPGEASPRAWKASPSLSVKRNLFLPLIGLDLIGESNRLFLETAAKHTQKGSTTGPIPLWKISLAVIPVWVGESLGKHPGDKNATFNKRSLRRLQHPRHLSRCEWQRIRHHHGHRCRAGEPSIALGHVDLIYDPHSASAFGADIALDEWQRRVQQVLPDGVQVRLAGAFHKRKIVKMLAAFRWNLRLLSYIAPRRRRVSSFNNTISVSRRAPPRRNWNRSRPRRQPSPNSRPPFSARPPLLA